MDFGQQRLQQQEAARQMMYQNQGYQFERRDKKTLILHYDMSNATTFNIDLYEPLKIDKLSDIYLESFTTFHSGAVPALDKNSSAFVFDINELNINNNSSTGPTFNKLVIPNELTSAPSSTIKRTIHKSKKLNYICSINPSTLTKISGTVTGLTDVTSMFTATNDGFIMELLIVGRD
tara:strand:+ start:311 stop:841 length:531 start_codon:yes stop_codon:yes gene_type:complete